MENEYTKARMDEVREMLEEQEKDKRIKHELQESENE